MSQDAFPFDGVNDASAAEEGDGRRKKLLLGGAGAVVLLLGGYLLLGTGGDAGTEEFIPTARAPRPVASTPAVVAKQLPAAYKEQIGRDPFRALYIQPAAAPPAVAGGTTSLPAPGVVVTSGGATTDFGAPSGGVATGGTTTPVAQEHKLVLQRVYGADKDRTASFSIDGKQQVAKIGAQFGPTSEIVLLSLQQGPKAGQWTAVLQVGDGDPFDVVTGTPVYVR